MNFHFTILIILLSISLDSNNQDDFDVISFEKERVLQLANSYSKEKPVTITNFVCERSAGSIHDFYSEGDYWWPDSLNPKGPYIRKDGLTNPDNFTKHREVMIRLSQISGALGSAYKITKDEKYAKLLIPHLQAWFIDENTKMNPNLLFGQAITGRVTGRGIGIIDTIHLMEVALAVKAIENSISVSPKDIATIKSWFGYYLEWLTSSSFGIAERDNGNNHSVCWAMQVAVFADLVGDEQQTNYCINFYKNTLLPDQMDDKGAFPLELARTKPYGYSIFNLDAMATLCQILSTTEENLFTYTKDGKSLALGLHFLVPYIKDKNSWPYQKDVMYWNDWPVRQHSLLFGGLALHNKVYIQTWKSLPTDFTKQEIIRNMPVRYPILWIN
jgi:hypothetical protein